jgi:hypothetical protein
MSEALTSEEKAYFDGYAADKTPVDKAPAPETGGEEGGEQQGQQQPGDGEQRRQSDVVPHAKFHEERERRRKAQDEANRLAQENAALRARFEERERMATALAPPQPKPPAPTLETDPTAYLKQNFATVQEELAALRQWKQQQESVGQQTQAIQRLVAAGRQSEQEFAKETPDYTDAAAYLQNTRDRELQLLGIADPNQRFQMIQQEVLQITDAALRGGKNFGQIVYEAAKLRGYTPKQAKQAQQAADEAVAETEATKALARANRGADFAAGVGNAGSAPPGNLTYEALMDMDEGEFLKAINTKAGRKLMGA